MKSMKTSVLHIEFTKESAQELLGKQSVRTTFKISERAIDGLSTLAVQLRIKQKSLFDHLMDDSTTLQQIAQRAGDFRLPEQRVAKTYVISRKTLQNLEQISQRHGVPRDTLVELSIERIFPLLAEEKKKHQARKQVLDRLAVFLREGEALYALVEKSLDVDDPVCRRVVDMLLEVQGCYEDVESSVVRGRGVEDF